MTRREELVEKFYSLCPGDDGVKCRTCPLEEHAVCNKIEMELTDADYEDAIQILESGKDDPYREMKERFIGADTFINPNAFNDSNVSNDNKFDVVERPRHYSSTSIECIDAMMETQGVEAVKAFCVCNAFKYLWRHNRKNGDEDIKKASWYLNKAVEIMGEEST